VAGMGAGYTWWQLPVTVIWLVGCANAMNLIDGIDGLAAGVGLFATLTVLLAALWTGNAALALATAPQAAALLAFLRYNFNPATVFLGDCGSLSIGFLLGCYGVIWTEKSATLLGMTAPLIALCIPLLETALSIARRFLRGKPIFGADRGHIHHRLLDLGLHPRRIAFVMYTAAGIAAACSLLVSISGSRWAGWVVLAFCLCAGFAVHRLDYLEFREARHVLFSGVLTRVIDTQVALQQLDHQLKDSRSLEESDRILTESARRFGFNEVRLQVGSQAWRHRMGTAARSDCWQVQVPLSGTDFAEFSIALNVRRHPMMLSAFASLVRQHLVAQSEIASSSSLIRAAQHVAENSTENLRSVKQASHHI
jgi:UDP-GlcNAc:undecaprenyl-phosphate/decaprenyl-phosphate GlcNAc-1-phosphate transferase